MGKKILIDPATGKPLMNSAGKLYNAVLAPKPEQSKTLTLGANTPQTVTPDNGKALSSVPVELDTSIIKAENIKKDVQMLGITGTHEGGGGCGIPPPVFSTVLFKDEGSRYAVCHCNPGEDRKATTYRRVGGSLEVKNINCFGYVEAYGRTDSITVSPSDACIALGLFDDGPASKYYYVYKNCTVTIVSSCFLPDTLITLADGTKKQIKDITYTDKLKVWNFDTGEFDTSPICWLTKSGLKNYHYYKLTFSDGTILKTTGHNSNHKIYNVDERFFKGVDKTEIGDRIFSEKGIVTVTNKEYIEEEIEYYNLITTGTINCFAEGILTSDRYGNLYPIDENMMYIKDGRYRPYEEFEAVGIKRYWYDTLRLAEVSGTIEETAQYIAKLECQMLPYNIDKVKNEAK